MGSFTQSARIISFLFIATGATGCKKLALGGCEEVGQNTGGLLDVGGGVISHSMNELAGSVPDLPSMQVGILSRAELLAGSDEGPLAEGPLEDPDGAAGVGAFCFLDTDVSSAENGIAAAIEEDGSEDSDWAPTVTGLATAAELAEHEAEGEPINHRGTFVVTRAAMDEVLGPMTGLSGEELLERGILFGLVYADPRSEDGEASKGVSGLTVTPSDDSLRIVYPNDRFSGTSSETGKQGAFLAIPPAGGGPMSASFTVNDDGGKASWAEAGTGLLLPGVLYFHLMFTDE